MLEPEHLNSLTSYAMGVKLFKFSVPQFLHLRNRYMDNNEVLCHKGIRIELLFIKFFNK